MLEELKKDKFVIIEGVVHTLTPLNRIEDLEVEAKKEVEIKVRSEMSSEQLIRELGRAGEFFTENNWRHHFIGGDTKNLLMVAPFEGGVMEHEQEKRKFKLYIPRGWVGLDMRIEKFPTMHSEWVIMPRRSNELIKKVYSDYKSIFHKVHPHTFGDGKLCGGMNPPTKFDINFVVQIIKDVITGSKKEKGTSIWDYNKDSPAENINICTYGKMAYELHKKGRNDDEVWNEIITAKREKKNMEGYIERGEENEQI